MNIIARLLTTVIFPVALLTGATGCHHESAPKDVAAARESGPVVTVIYDAPLVPKSRPDLAIYSVRVDGESQTNVFVQGNEAARLVYTDPEPGELLRVSDDGTHGVYRRFISPGKTLDIAVEFQKHES